MTTTPIEEAQRPSKPGVPAEGKRAVIIGSGFGGAVVARRLAQAKKEMTANGLQPLEIVLLERGRRYAAQDFPRLQLPEQVPEPALRSSKRMPDAARTSWAYDQGLWQVRNLGGLRVAVAAGLGGGSLIYASVHLRPPPSVFESGWPTTYGLSDLDPYYRLVEAMLDVETAPSGWTKTARMEQTYTKLGRQAQTFRPPLAITFRTPPKGRNRFGVEQAACIGCGDCDIGCQHGAKNTLDLNYLAGIEADGGVTVKTLAEVITITASDSGATSEAGCESAPADSDAGRGFTVRYRDHLLGGREFDLPADYVFLCAGAVGSTEILLRSRHRLAPARRNTGLRCLGETFFANGDAVGVVFDTERAWQPSSGPIITTTLYHKETVEGGTPVWFLLQEGGIPPTLTRGLGALRSPLWLGRNAYGKPARTAPQGDPRSSPRGLATLLEAIPALPQMASVGAAEHLPGGTADKLVTSFLPDSIRKLLLPVEPPSRFVLQQVQRVIARVAATLARGGSGGRARMFAGPFISAAAADDDLAATTVQALVAEFPALAALPDSQTALGAGLRALVGLLLGPPPTEHTAILLAMGPDMHWRLSLRHERLHAHGDVSAHIRLYGAQERLMREVTEKLGGELRTNPAWSISEQPMTVHAQGGCSMSNRTNGGGVTCPEGLMVRGVPNLYVFDASVFPTSVGVNPSSTIAAVAERNIELFIRNTCGLPDWTAVDAEERETGNTGAFTKLMKAKGAQWANGPKLVLDPLTPPPDIKPATVEIPALHWTEVMEGFVADAPDLPTGFPLPALGRGPIGEAAFRLCERRGREKLHRLRVELAASMPDVEQALQSRGRTILDIKGRVLWWPQHAINQRSCKPNTCDVKGKLITSVSRREHLGRMTYSLEGVGAPFRLDGVKQLRDNPGLDAWKDLTTLYVRVTAGGTSYAGIIRLPLVDFLGKQLPHMDVPGDDISPMRKTWWILRYFARFHSGLSQIYTPKGL